MVVISKACEKRGVGLELSAEPWFPPVNTLPHSDQKKACEERGVGLELSAEPWFPPVNTVPHGGYIESL